MFEDREGKEGRCVVAVIRDVLGEGEVWAR